MSPAREESFWPCPRLSYLDGVIQSLPPIPKAASLSPELHHDLLKLILEKLANGDCLQNAETKAKVDKALSDHEASWCPC